MISPESLRVEPVNEKGQTCRFILLVSFFSIIVVEFSVQVSAFVSLLDLCIVQYVPFRKAVTNTSSFSLAFGCITSESVAAAALCPYLYDRDFLKANNLCPSFRYAPSLKKKKKATTASFASKNIKQNGEIQCVVPTQIIPGIQNVEKKESL